MSEGAGQSPAGRAIAPPSPMGWEDEFRLLAAADANGLLGAADLPRLAEVAYAAGHLEVTIEAWERTHAACLRAGDRAAAGGAAVRVAMHLLLDTALMAPVRGWLARAEGLLDGEEESAAHAWFAVVRSYERMLAGDLAAARTWAPRAVDVGSRWDPAAGAIGRVATARLLILEGEVADGLALLDEAGVATVSGDLDPLSTGVVFCELVCALQGLALYDLAEEWTEAMERWSATNAIGSLHGRCRVHRAEILRLRGSCDEAEEQALAACDELRPFLRRELGWPLSELGRIRLNRGDVAGAEDAMLAAHGAGWDPQPGLALVRLAQGDAPAAVVAIRDALDRPLPVPSKERPPNNDLHRAPLLAAQVQIEVAGGDLDRARRAAGELDRIAALFGSNALLAEAVQARGRVQLAEGRSAEAEGSLSEAVRRWNDVGAPYEAAMARMALADAHAASGGDARAALERGAARRALDRIGATPAAASPSLAGDASRPAVANTFRLEGDHRLIVFDGRLVRTRDLKGMRYLARLLTTPNREHHVLDLVAGEMGAGPARPGGASGVDRSMLGDAGEVLDPGAKEAYRRRLIEIDDDIDEATALGDDERAAQAEAERELLLRELSRAFGLGGRARRAGSASERARVSVTRAIRQSMARIAGSHPELGEHLQLTIRTGTYCSYAPDPRVPTSWIS